MKQLFHVSDSLQVSLLPTNYNKVHIQKIKSKNNPSIRQLKIKMQIKGQINLWQPHNFIFKPPSNFICSDLNITILVFLDLVKFYLDLTNN